MAVQTPLDLDECQGHQYWCCHQSRDLIHKKMNFNLTPADFARSYLYMHNIQIISIHSKHAQYQYVYKLS